MSIANIKVGILLHNVHTHQTARVIAILPDPFFIEGVHEGAPELMVYVGPDSGWTDYWYPANCVAELDPAEGGVEMALIQLENPTAPFCCPECSAALTDFHMQHFRRRTLISGACNTESCSKRQSHQAAMVVWAAPERRPLLELVGKHYGISIGVFLYDADDAQIIEAVQS